MDAMRCDTRVRTHRSASQRYLAINVMSSVGRLKITRTVWMLAEASDDIYIRKVSQSYKTKLEKHLLQTLQASLRDAALGSMK